MAEPSDYARRAAARNFKSARQRADLQDILARLAGRSNDLLAFEDVRRLLKGHLGGKRELREIPLDAIVGSVGRYKDFTRQFFPRNQATEDRWSNIKVEMEGLVGVPPIEVYQIGDAYFVLDGNHRVSVAREAGSSHIEAYVTEVDTRVPLSSIESPDSIILKAEQTDFLEATDLDRTRSDADLTVTVPGQYVAMLEDIQDKRQAMEQARGDWVPLPEAAAAWYDEVYLPIVRIIRQRGLLRSFPGRTETDLYVWISRRRDELEQALGWAIDPARAAADLTAGQARSPMSMATDLLHAVTPEVLESGPPAGQWRRDRQVETPNDRLAVDILVPINGAPDGWTAFDQAVIVARREGGRLNGLHVVPTAEQKQSPATQSVKAEFDRRCAETGVPGNLVIEVGGVTAVICDRARWADLVVVNLAYPPGGSPIARLRNGFRGLVQLCPRPILAVPHTVSALNAALVSYDGSPKATEALYAAAYLALQWGTRLVVLSVLADGPVTAQTLTQARLYLDAYGVQADYVTATGPVAEAILHTLEDKGCDLIMMGGYGNMPLVGAVLGSAVDKVLRASPIPVLICR